MYQVQKHREYRQKIISSYQVSCLEIVVWLSLNMLNQITMQCLPPFCSHIVLQRSGGSLLLFLICLQPLHRELYTMHPETTFVPSFLKAISDNTEESFRSIMSEPSPGIFTFEILHPRFCELLLLEVLLVSFHIYPVVYMMHRCHPFFLWCFCLLGGKFWKMGK